MSIPPNEDHTSDLSLDHVGYRNTASNSYPVPTIQVCSRPLKVPKTKPLNLPLSSYVVDPHWQRKFSIVWPTVLGFFVLLSVPHLVRSIRNGRHPTPFGIWEDCTGQGDYAAIVQPMLKAERKRTGVLCRMESVIGKFGALFYWTLPGLGLNAGQRSSFPLLSN